MKEHNLKMLHAKFEVSRSNSKRMKKEEKEKEEKEEEKVNHPPITNTLQCCLT